MTSLPPPPPPDVPASIASRRSFVRSIAAGLGMLAASRALARAGGPEPAPSPVKPATPVPLTPTLPTPTLPTPTPSAVAGARAAPERPAMDLLVPPRIRTATFALG